MIFFFSDYLNYRNETGNYRHENCEALGYKRGKYFVNNEPKPLPGDALVVHTRFSFVSWLVMYYTNSLASHVCLFLENGILFDFTTSGLVEHHVSDYYEDRYYLQIRILREEKVGFEFRTTLMKSYNEVMRHRMMSSRFSWTKIIRMWYNIITAAKLRACFKWKFYLDYLILFSILFFLFYNIENLLSARHLFSNVTLLIFALYTLILVKNKIKYRILDKGNPPRKMGELY